jgi:hypothetical protein
MNKFLNKVVEYGGHMTGSTTRKLGRDIEALRRFEYLGNHGVPRSTILHAEDLLGRAKTDSIKARVGTGLSAAALGTGAYLGMKKYYQYQDNKILEKIDRMSNMEYNPY